MCLLSIHLSHHNNCLASPIIMQFSQCLEEQEKVLPCDPAESQQSINHLKTATSQAKEYLDLLNLTELPSIDEDELAMVLQKEKVRYNPKEKFQNEVQISLEEFSSNYESIKINVKYGHFSTILNLINIDLLSPVKHLGESIAGSYGKVYQYSHNDIPVAIKCIRIRQNNFDPLLRGAIKEYLLLTVAAALRVGPSLVRLFGFDLAVFRDEICFGMEYCDMGLAGIDWLEMKRMLHLLHQLHVVHLDIKPENLGFSKMNNCFVFIDFGLSKVIKEPLGSKTKITFTGSMNFCSAEMLDLFLNDDFGMVELYLNDACCLQKTMDKVIQQSSQSHVLEGQEIYYAGYMVMAERGGLQQFQSYCTLQLIKFTLFELACKLTCEIGLLSRYSEVIKRHQAELNQFISTLPQTLQLIYYYKAHLRVHMCIDDPELISEECFINKEINLDQVPSLFLDRFRVIDCINNRWVDHLDTGSLEKAMENILFDRQWVRKSRNAVYWLALARFIRINSFHRNFESKVQACKIFNQSATQMDGTIMPDTQIYKITVRAIFKGALADLLEPQALQILRNTVETVIILEIVTEEQLCQAYSKVLALEMDICQKLTVAIQFITSIQFVKEKHRKQYDYDRLLTQFLSQLNAFIEGKMADPTAKSTDQEIIFNVIKFLISRSIKISIPKTKLYELFSIADPQKIILANKRLNNAMGGYIMYSMVRDQLLEYDASKQRYIQEILIWIRQKRYKFDNFTFIHLALFNATEKIRQDKDSLFIYHIFQQELRHFEEHTHFNIYLHHRINTLKRSLSTEHIQRKFNIHEKEKIVNDRAGGKDTALYEEIFSILDHLVKHSNTFHSYIEYLLIKPPAIYSSPTCRRYVGKLIEDNPEKIIKLSRGPDQAHEFHYTNLKYEIFVVSHIFQYMPYCISAKDWRKFLEKFMEECEQAIANISCIECKVHALIYLNQIYSNYLHVQEGESEKPFLIIVDSLIFELKNSDVFEHVIEILVPMVRRWCKYPSIHRKYNLEGFIYEHIKTTGNYHYCLMDIKEFTIFPQIYLYIIRFLPDAELIEFLENVTLRLSFVKSIDAIDNFYYSILFMIVESKNLGSIQNFKHYHDRMIQGFLSFTRVRENAYIALYLYALLDIRLRTGVELRMLRVISLLMRSIDRYSRKLILNNFYEYFAACSQIPLRKKVHICFQHLKMSSQRFSLRFVLAMKLAKPAQHKHRTKIFKKYIKKYHANLGNLT